MKFRFTLHDQLDAELIAHILFLANGASHNLAMKKYVQFQRAIEIDRNMSPASRASDSKVTNSELDFSALDAEFDDFKE